MQKIDELKYKLYCEKCHRNLGTYLMEACGHRTCYNCFRDKSSYCSICGRLTSRAQVKFVSDIEDELFECWFAVRDLTNESENMKKENEVLKKEKEELATRLEENAKLLEDKARELVDVKKCAECEIQENEKKMYLCGTCHKLEFEDSEDVDKHAICSDCVIKKHMRQNHHTVDFFPYLSAHRFSKLSKDIASKSEELKESQVFLTASVSSFEVMAKRINDNIDLLTDMARRSQSSKCQIETFENIGSLIEESKTFNTKMDSEMKNSLAVLQASLLKIEEWCAARTESCVGDSETIKLPSPAASNNNSDT